MRYSVIGKLIDHLLKDQEIRKLLRKNPREAAKLCGITLEEDEVDALKQVDWNVADAELRARISKGM